MNKNVPSTNTLPENNTNSNLVYHSSNPFVEAIVEYMEEGKHRKVVGHSWQKVVDESTGSTNTQKILVLGDHKVVDKQEYSKLYMGTIQKFFGLSKSSLKLLDYIMNNIRYDQDKICLHYPDVKEQLSMIKSTLYSCIRQLIAEKIIARASTPGCYYINPAIVFKGDRIAVVQQYIKDSIPTQYELDTMTYDNEIQDIPGNEDELR